MGFPNGECPAVPPFVVPIARRLSQGEYVSIARTETLEEVIDLPVEELVLRLGGWPGAALLETTGEEFGSAGRWSILTARPRWVFEAKGTDWLIRQPAGLALAAGERDPLGVLGHLLGRYRLAQPSDVPDPEGSPFQGGLIGYLGYDLAPQIERLSRRVAADSDLPDLRFGLYDTAVIVDHRLGQATLIGADLLDEGTRAVERRLKDWRTALMGPAPRRSTSVLETPIVSRFTREEYCRAVRRALDYIAAGDIFQVNLSQRFEARGRIDSLDLYLRLRRRSPAPFAAFLDLDGSAVVSASPEWFYATQGEVVVTRPIKGTRPRGSSASEDRRLAAELAQSSKDRAELTMIVDLERNDLGRVCSYGSVKVVDPLAVETFAQVHHLVATVEGRLRPEVGPIDLVRAIFPGGSITGAPKIRAMEIIDELEGCRRGVYTGAIGYFSRGGTSAFNIAIRTMIVEGNRVCYQVGGGIVADSDPESEYEETMHKGRGLREVLEGR